MLPMVFVIALAAMPHPASRLHFQLRFTDVVHRGIDPLIASEAAHVWAPYGVTLSVAGAAGDAECQAGTVHVEILDRPRGSIDDHALGAIAFYDGAPRPDVSLYVEPAADLVASVAGGAMSQWTIAYRNAVMGRVLGRALAHEIGHYLLNTREHAPAGLMRAVQPINELMGVADPKMVLTAREQVILRMTIYARNTAEQ
jgi:hypothetical protein